MVFSEIHLTGRVKLALPNCMGRGEPKKSNAGTRYLRSAIVQRIRSDNGMAAGFFIALSSIHSFDAKKGD